MIDWRRWLSATAVLTGVAILVAGCGQKPGEGTADGASSGGDGPQVALVSDIGGFSDRSFNESAKVGLDRAVAELGANAKEAESKSQGDYASNLGAFAQDSATELVIGVGFTMADALKEVAAKAPDTQFAIIDFATQGDNVLGIAFKEQEAGYLAGSLAGMVEGDGKLKGLNAAHVVSVVGGKKIPPVDKYIAGFQAGVISQCKDCKVLVDYSDDFLDQTKCKDRALTQIAKGSDIVFQVAGGCGEGALKAAKEKGVWGIGVDADQAYLGSHILTSAMKRVDLAVYDVIKSVQDGTFQGGTDKVYGLAEEGVGLGEISPAAAAYEPRMQQVIDDVTSGKVEIPSEVK